MNGIFVLLEILRTCGVSYEAYYNARQIVLRKDLRKIVINLRSDYSFEDAEVYFIYANEEKHVRNISKAEDVAKEFIIQNRP
jgi:hypothetical protein